MKEIGSEFWNIPIKENNNNLFPKHTEWYVSGRSALYAIISELKDCHSVEIPAWCCDSIIKPFIEAGFLVSFYSVNDNQEYNQKPSLKYDVLFIMDFFGYSSRNLDLSGYDGVIIRDVTHSLFSDTRTDADYYFGSLRKWCGVWTGGFAWTNDKHRLPMEEVDITAYSSLREKAMLQKEEYINGLRKDKGFLSTFANAEEVIDDMRIAPADNRDVQLAKKLDVELIRKRRRSNAIVLLSAFPEWLIFSELSSKDTPMFVPIIIPDGRRDELRSYLVQHSIYCPIHWPTSEYHMLDDDISFIYENELSLVCDQRYTEKDMYRVVETIRAFWKE